MDFARSAEILDRLRLHASSRPADPALSEATRRDSTLSYECVVARVERQAALLPEHVNGTELCVLVTRRHTGLCCSLLAGLAAERPVAVFDPRQGLHRLRELLALAGSGLVVADGFGRELFAQLELKLCAKLPAQDETGRELSAHRFGPRQAAAGAAPAGTAVVLFTSGSTGTPRGVCVSTADIAFRARAEIEWFGLTPDDTTLGVLPLSFDVGLAQFLGTLWSGGHHVLLGSWLPGDVARAVADWKPSGMAASPLIWQAQLRGAGSSLSALRGLRFATLSGGDLSERPRLALVEALVPCRLFKTYGLSEMFRVASLRPEDFASRPASVGRAYPGTGFAVVREDGSECDPDEIGEVVAWGGGLMSGYLNRDVESPIRCLQGISRAAAAPGLHTGDLGSVDRDGFLTLAGRRDDMLKVADQRVYPLEVARLVEALLRLESVVIVPFASATGTAFAAFHTDRGWNGREAQGLGELRKHLPGHMIPKRLIGLDEIPATASGKPDRAALVRLL